LAQQDVSVEVIDLRSLRPLDTTTLFRSVEKTHRLIVVDEGWRTGSLAGELCALVAENCFWSLDAPPIRVCSEEVPIPYPKHLEDAVTPQVAKIIEAVLGLLKQEIAS
jgi:pyruvate/2-oxoglutarate/acetoin dehydrogenase E1 component